MFKNLNNGSIKTEMITNELLEKYEPLNYEFIKETKYHDKFNINGVEYEFLIENVSDVIDQMKNKNWKNRKCLPVYTNIYHDNILPNSKLQLLNEETDQIYYSIDGSDWKLYHDEILIDKDCEIKTYAKKEGFLDSDIVNYHFRLRNRILKIYFSPSRQINNKGIDSKIYPSEMEMMNLLSKKIVDRINNYKVICYQNNPDLFIKDWLEEGIQKNIDVHFAIHSNATSMRNKKGPEIWVDKPTSEPYSLANKIYQNLYSIYYDNQNPITNRGVKFANSNLMECNDQYFKFGLLLETAYHDNLEDSKWMSNNLDLIADNITKSLVEYFQLEKD